MPGRGRPRKYASTQEATRARVARFRHRQKFPYLQDALPGSNRDLSQRERSQSPDVFTDLQVALEPVNDNEDFNDQDDVANPDLGDELNQDLTGQDSDRSIPDSSHGDSDGMSCSQFEDKQNLIWEPGN